MLKDSPAISIIIPVQNRAELLRPMLDALSAQTYPLARVEVLIVVDQGSDRAQEMLPTSSTPFNLRIIEPTAPGMADMRNCGAASAQNQLLLFLNDNIKLTPGLVEAHVRAHVDGPNRVAIGPYPFLLREPADLFGISLRVSWGARFRAISRFDHRFTFRDLLTGNFSLRASLFDCAGGFDSAFSNGGEDFDLGMRLLHVGARFICAVDGLAYQVLTSNLDDFLQHVRQAGQADVLLARRYPELRATLPLASLKARGPRPSRILRPMAFTRPSLGDSLAAYLRHILDPLERLKLRRRWHWVYLSLQDYWYWRGVAEEMGSRKNLKDFLKADSAPDQTDGLEIELQLNEGLEAAELRLDAERPASARICYGQQMVGHILPQPGAEPLRGVHLRRILATTLAAPLLKALACEGIEPETKAIDDVFIAQEVPLSGEIYANKGA